MAEQQQKIVPWDDKQARELIEPARKIFQQVTRKDESGLIWQREADFAVAAITRDPYFKRCPADTIIEAVKNVAHIGLTLNPTRQHAVIIPRYVKKLERYEAGALVMYRGFMHLATEAGVHRIKSEAVYAMDHFIYGSDSTRGDFYEYLLNKDEEQDTPGNPFLGTFVSANMPSGGVKLEWVSAKDIFKIRLMSDSYLDKDDRPRRNSPWVQWFGEMAKKAGIKRAQKRWEEMITDSDQWDRFLRAVQLDNKTEGVIQEEIRDATPDKPGEAVVCLSKEQIAEIRKQLPTKTYEQKICEAYRVKTLERVEATRYQEILDRIKAAKDLAVAEKNKKAGGVK